MRSYDSPKSAQQTWIAVACSVVGVGLIGLFAWGCSTHEAQGTVVAMTWEQDTLLQHWTPVVKGAWEHDTWQCEEVPPVDGRGEKAGWSKIWLSCRQKAHGTEWYDCGTDSDGHTKRCSRTEYRTWCDYNTQEWRTTRTEKAAGLGRGTEWKVVEPGPLDRIRYEAVYLVGFDYVDMKGKGTYGHDPSGTVSWGGRKLLTESEAKDAERKYLSWNVGDEAVLLINNFGSVRSVEKGRMTVEAK